jgi:GNAT superfamily N-acetyltransferase
MARIERSAHRSCLEQNRKTGALFELSTVTEGAFAMNSPACFHKVIELGPQHEGELARLLVNLGPESRVSRFNCAASDAFVLRHSQQAIKTTAWLAGIVIYQRVRGVVEVYDMDPPGVAEAAFLVDQAWRRRGLGTALLRATMQWAAEHDRVLLRMMFSRSNSAMRGLATNAGARLDPAFDEVVADLPIAPVARVKHRRGDWPTKQQERNKFVAPAR